MSLTLLTLLQFVTTLLLSFSILVIVAGAFTIYFGSGKSRIVGVILALLGVVVGIAIAYYYHIFTNSFTILFVLDLEVVIAVAIGLLAAFLLFLAAIMKT